MDMLFRHLFLILLLCVGDGGRSFAKTDGNDYDLPGVMGATQKINQFTNLMYGIAHTFRS